MKKPTKLLEFNPQTNLNDQFRPHGSYEATLTDNMVYAEVTGPLNLEALRLYSAKLNPVLNELPINEPIGWISVFHVSMMMPPEGVALFAQKVAELSAAGIVWAVAHVAGEDVEGRKMMAGIYAEKVFGPSDIPYKLFSDTQSATAWLEQQRNLLGS